MPVLARDESIISAVEMRKINDPESLIFSEGVSQETKNEMIRFGRRKMKAYVLEEKYVVTDGKIVCHAPE